MKLVFVVFLKKRTFVRLKYNISTREYFTGILLILSIMKKQSSLPDFHKLCVPAQNHIAYRIGLEIFYFFVASFGGFLWEVLLFLIKEGSFYNRGFLYGPWLPVYGVGAVVFSLCMQFCQKSIWRIFVFSVLLGTGLELAIGWLLDTVWNLRYWDYSDYFGNFRGYICLASAIGFGVAGAFWICLLAPLLEKFYKKIPASVQCTISTLLILAFLCDCAASLIFPNLGIGITF